MGWFGPSGACGCCDPDCVDQPDPCCSLVISGPNGSDILDGYYRVTWMAGNICEPTGPAITEIQIIGSKNGSPVSTTVYDADDFAGLATDGDGNYTGTISLAMSDLYDEWRVIVTNACEDTAECFEAVPCCLTTNTLVLEFADFLATYAATCTDRVYSDPNDGKNSETIVEGLDSINGTHLFAPSSLTGYGYTGSKTTNYCHVNSFPKTIGTGAIQLKSFARKLGLYGDPLFDNDPCGATYPVGSLGGYNFHRFEGDYVYVQEGIMSEGVYLKVSTAKWTIEKPGAVSGREATPCIADARQSAADAFVYHYGVSASGDYSVADWADDSRYALVTQVNRHFYISAASGFVALSGEEEVRAGCLTHDCHSSDWCGVAVGPTITGGNQLSYGSTVPSGAPSAAMPNILIGMAAFSWCGTDANYTSGSCSGYLTACTTTGSPCCQMALAKQKQVYFVFV